MPLMGLGARPPNIAGNFPTIDDYNEVLKIATSVKSMDATKYLNPKRFEARIRRYRKLVEDFVPPKNGDYKGIAIEDFRAIARDAEKVIQDQCVAYKRYADK